MGTSLDRRWYRALAPYSIEVLPYLKSDLHKLQAQKHAFLSGAIANPVLDYSHIEIEAIALKTDGLRALKEQIVTEEKNPVLRELYIAKIDEYLSNAQLLQASYEASVSPSESSKAMQRFEAANRYLYGEMDQEIFDLTLYTLKRKLARVNEEVKEKNKKEYELLFSLTRSAEKPARIYPFSIERTQHKDKTVVRDIAQITRILTQALNARGLADTWKVEVDTTDLLHTFSVINHKRVIAIPGEKFFREHHGGYYAAHLKGLIAHEVDTHIMRRHNGKQSPLRLLSAGLDRYHRGEEGIATFRAQRQKGSRSFAGFLGYLSLGLALGMEKEGARKHFGELYNYLRAYFLVVGGFDAGKAEERAWHACWRVFRGTTGMHSGTVFMRDAMYREGNVLIHKMLHEYPDAEKDLDIGNFDPTKETHVTALLKLGLLPENPWKEIAQKFAR